MTLLSLSACNYFKNVRLLQAGETGESDFVWEIPFELRKDLIVIEVEIQGQRGDFIFDTGAFNSKIASDWAELLGLEAKAYKTNQDTHDKERRIGVVQIPSLKMGEAIFENISAGSLAKYEESAARCIAPGGIIGANLIKLAHWKIDYEARLLYCSNRPFSPEPGEPFYQLPFKRPVLSGKPRVTMQVAGKEVQNIIFDTGCNTALRLPKEIRPALGLGEGMSYVDASVSGIYGVKQDTFVEEMLPLAWGGDEREVPVTFSNRSKGLLGNPYLKQFVVYLDYDSKQIGLQPKTSQTLQLDNPFLVGIRNDSTWEVARAPLSSPLKVGQKLRRVQGYRPREVFADYCAYVEGIADFLEGDSLQIETWAGEQLQLSLNSLSFGPPR